MSTATSAPLPISGKRSKRRSVTIIRATDKEKFEALNEPRIQAILSNVRLQLRLRRLFSFARVQQSCQKTFDDQHMDFELNGDQTRLDWLKVMLKAQAKTKGLKIKISQETHLVCLRQDVDHETVDLKVTLSLA